MLRLGIPHKPNLRPVLQLVVGGLMLLIVLVKLTACDTQRIPSSVEEIEEEGPSDSLAYQLVWADEFATDGLPDASKWNYDLGGHGWGNNELQHYTQRAENARVEDGLLIIEAHRENYQSREYTSARLVTRDRQHWTYGRISVRANLPSGRGTWPAIWMLGTNISEVGWPLSCSILVN